MERGRLERRWVDALHFQQLSRFGGLRGTRDEGAPESALGRPRHQWLYGKERELARLAAAYAFGLAATTPAATATSASPSWRWRSYWS